MSDNNKKNKVSVRKYDIRFLIITQKARVADSCN